MFFTIWLVIGIGMLTLLIAAMGRQEKDSCKDYSIRIKGVRDADLFLDENDVIRLLQAAVKGPIKGQRKEVFNLRQMEQLLEDNSWVKDADLYFDSRDILHVTITERQPIARVFTTSGRSFYIDDSGKELPLSYKVSARLPVFTEFPARKQLLRSDSILLKDMVNTADFIAGNPFWMAQVSQLAIRSCGADCWSFDMTPVVGNHIVRLGDGKNVQQKFRRLMIFYRQVLSRTGFDKYKVVDVSFAGQVVGIKGAISKVDSLQLRRNVEDLLRQSREMNAMMEIMPAVNIDRPLVPNEELGESNPLVEEDTAPAPPVVNQPPARTAVPVSPASRSAAPAAGSNVKQQAAGPVKPPPNRVPKAVMPPRNGR